MFHRSNGIRITKPHCTYVIVICSLLVLWCIDIFASLHLQYVIQMLSVVSKNHHYFKRERKINSIYIGFRSIQLIKLFIRQKLHIPSKYLPYFRSFQIATDIIRHIRTLHFPRFLIDHRIAQEIA